MLHLRCWRYTDKTLLHDSLQSLFLQRLLLEESYQHKINWWNQLRNKRTCYISNKSNYVHRYLVKYDIACAITDSGIYETFFSTWWMSSVSLWSIRAGISNVKWLKWKDKWYYLKIISSNNYLILSTTRWPSGCVGNIYIFNFSDISLSLQTNEKRNV